MPTIVIYKKDKLIHHGILGQKWGKKNGPPYPLGASDHSASEKKAGWKKSLGGGRNESEYGRSDVKKYDKAKRHQALADVYNSQNKPGTSGYQRARAAAEAAKHQRKSNKLRQNLGEDKYLKIENDKKYASDREKDEQALERAKKSLQDSGRDDLQIRKLGDGNYILENKDPSKRKINFERGEVISDSPSKKESKELAKQQKKEEKVVIKQQKKAAKDLKKMFDEAQSEEYIKSGGKLEKLAGDKYFDEIDAIQMRAYKKSVDRLTTKYGDLSVDQINAIVGNKKSGDYVKRASKITNDSESKKR